MGYKKCPNCGALIYTESETGNITCESCGTIFSASSTGSNQPSLNSRLAEIRRRVSMGQTSSRNGMSGEDIFSQNINGVVVIECADMGSAGSGLVYDKYRGLVITNSHVVLGEQNNITNDVYVTVGSNTYPAKVILCGTPDTTDIAVLKVNAFASDVIQVKLGNSNDVKNGQTVYAIGNSLGEGLCITKGIISDKDRIIDDIHLIMTDVATNPGNSGCPIFDESGKVIGVHVSARKGAVGMKFCIPINDALAFIEKNLG